MSRIQHMISKMSAFVFLAMLFGFAVVSPAAFAQVLYGTIGAGLTNSWLVTINPANGAILSTIGLVGDRLSALAFNPVNGDLYGSTGLWPAPQLPI